MREMAEGVQLFLLLLFLAKIRALGILHEAKIGSTVELPCPSSDDEHRFQFWIMLDGTVLGPGNEKDPAKYKYDVLSGRLHIKSITSSEGGFYTCISKSIEDISIFHSESVEVIIKRDWEEVYETDNATNLMRGLIAVGVLLIILVIGIVVYTLKQTRIIHITDMTDVESPDDGHETYNTAGLYTMPENQATTSHEGVDNPTLETDFPEVFRSMQQTNDTQI